MAISKDYDNYAYPYDSYGYNSNKYYGDWGYEKELVERKKEQQRQIAQMVENTFLTAKKNLKAARDRYYKSAGKKKYLDEYNAAHDEFKQAQNAYYKYFPDGSKSGKDLTEDYYVSNNSITINTPQPTWTTSATTTTTLKLTDPVAAKAEQKPTDWLKQQVEETAAIGRRELQKV